MSKEMRKKPRRPMCYNAWIGVDRDTPLRGCVVADISETGARLKLKNPSDLPNSFTLLLNGRTGLHRLCHAVWRNENHIGVHFATSAAQAHDATSA